MSPALKQVGLVLAAAGAVYATVKVIRATSAAREAMRAVQMVRSEMRQEIAAALVEGLHTEGKVVPLRRRRRSSS